MQRFAVILACITTGILLVFAWHRRGQAPSLPPAVPVLEALSQFEVPPATPQIAATPRTPVGLPNTLENEVRTMVVKVPFRGGGRASNPSRSTGDPQHFAASLRIRYRSHAPSVEVLRLVKRYEKATRDELGKLFERQTAAMLAASGDPAPRALFVEELRRALQLWLFRHGTATVEGIEDLTVAPAAAGQNSIGFAFDLANYGSLLWQPADLEMKFRFNPQTDRDRAFAQISFTLAFRIQPGKLQAAKESVTNRMNQARSRCLELLSRQSVHDLKTPKGVKQLQRLLKEELTRILFPGFQDERIARVEDIFWTSYLVQ